MEGGTGVFYQVMPAVGPDGKNVMKLIPVQKVNGQFTHIQTVSSIQGAQTAFPHPVRITSSSVSQNKIPVVEPTADGKFILKGPTNTSNRLIKSQQQVNSPKVLVGQVRLPVAPPIRTPGLVSLPVNISGTTVACQKTSQLPVTVSSPRLPSGHYLQIPPDAKVQTLPASALPQSIKNRILNLPHDTPSREKSSTVLYVSPVNSMRIESSKLKDTTPSVTQNISRTVSVSNKKSSTCSPSGPVQSPKPAASDCVTPMKWVVQQGDASSAPCLVPASPTCMTSEILKAVAQMEKKSSGTPNPSSSQEGQTNISPSTDDALVMCNGKVFFVTKKDSELCASTKKSHAATKEGPSSNKPTESPSFSLGSHKSAAKQDLQPICIDDDDPSEVIDLCDDDSQTDGTRVKDGAVVTVEEEDDSNVIFVSYIPPKTSATKNATDAPSGTDGVQPDQPVLVSSNGELTKEVVPEHENCASGEQTENCQDMIDAEPVSGIKNSVGLTTEEHCLDEQILACDTIQTLANCEERKSSDSNISEVINGQSLGNGVDLEVNWDTMTEDCSNSGEAQETVAVEARTDSELVGELAPAGMESKSFQGNQVIHTEPSDLEDITQNTKNTNQVQSLIVPVKDIMSMKERDQQSQQERDRQMRKLFGITKDIKICLKMISSGKRETSTEPKSINKRTLDGIRRLIQGSQMELKAKRLIEAQVHLAKDAKRRKVESSRNPSEKTGQSEATGQCDVSSKHGQNTVPFASVTEGSTTVSTNVLKVKASDVDSRDDTDRLPSTDTGSPSLEETATKPQACPGGSQSSIAGSCHSHVDISTQAATSEKIALQPEEVVKRREEPSLLEVEPYGSACEDGRSVAETSNKELFSTESMEPEEIQRWEKIKRLKELLKEKEAALEMMRRKMSM